MPNVEIKKTIYSWRSDKRDIVSIRRGDPSWTTSLDLGLHVSSGAFVTDSIDSGWLVAINGGQLARALQQAYERGRAEAQEDIRAVLGAKEVGT